MPAEAPDQNTPTALPLTQEEPPEKNNPLLGTFCGQDEGRKRGTGKPGLRQTPSKSPAKGQLQEAEPGSKERESRNEAAQNCCPAGCGQSGKLERTFQQAICQSIYIPFGNNPQPLQAHTPIAGPVFKGPVLSGFPSSLPTWTRHFMAL